MDITNVFRRCAFKISGNPKYQCPKSGDAYQPHLDIWYCTFHDKLATKRCQVFAQWEGTGIQCTAFATVKNEETGQQLCDKHARAKETGEEPESDETSNEKVQSAKKESKKVAYIPIHESRPKLPRAPPFTPTERRKDISTPPPQRIAVKYQPKETPSTPRIRKPLSVPSRVVAPQEKPKYASSVRSPPPPAPSKRPPGKEISSPPQKLQTPVKPKVDTRLSLPPQPKPQTPVKPKVETHISSPHPSRPKPLTLVKAKVDTRISSPLKSKPLTPVKPKVDTPVSSPPQSKPPTPSPQEPDVVEPPQEITTQAKPQEEPTLPSPIQPEPEPLNCCQIRAGISTPPPSPPILAQTIRTPSVSSSLQSKLAFFSQPSDVSTPPLSINTEARRKFTPSVSSPLFTKCQSFSQFQDGIPTPPLSPCIPEKLERTPSISSPLTPKPQERVFTPLRSIFARSQTFETPPTSPLPYRQPTFLVSLTPKRDRNSDGPPTPLSPTSEEYRIAALYLRCNICLNSHSSTVMKPIEPCGHQYRPLCLRSILQTGNRRQYNCASCRDWVAKLGVPQVS